MPIYGLCICPVGSKSIHSSWTARIIFLNGNLLFWLMLKSFSDFPFFSLAEVWNSQHNHYNTSFDISSLGNVQNFLFHSLYTSLKYFCYYPALSLSLHAFLTEFFLGTPCLSLPSQWLGFQWYRVIAHIILTSWKKLFVLLTIQHRPLIAVVHIYTPIPRINK